MKAIFAGLPGPSALPSPSLTWWFTQLGPGGVPGAASLGWIPQTQGMSEARDLAAFTLQFSQLVKPLPPLPPLSLVLHSHLSPLASERIL